MIGQTLAHYDILEPLGSGGMGEVFLAQDKNLGRKVAVKSLPAELAEDANSLARFEREAKLLASLSHPNIAVVYGLHEDGGRRFLAMELVPGEDLSQVLARGPLPAAEAVGIGAQVAEALSAAHEQQVIHRDLKPANIMITPEGRAKVLDFGLARTVEPDSSTPDLTSSPTLTSPATLAGMILGTAPYMSPEQARGRRLDRRTDIWALGCVLYEMLTGKRAFPGDTVTDVIAGIIHKEPDWSAVPATVPPGVVRIVKRCLHKDPGERYRDAGDVGMLLLEALAGQADEAGAAAVPRKRSLLWPAAVAVLALLSIVLLVRGTRKEGSGTGLPVRMYRVEIPDLEAQFNDAPLISPDGRRVAFSTGEGVWIRDLDQLDARQLEVAKGGSTPFWSPDGGMIAFQDEEKLWKVPSAGGERSLICDLPVRGRIIGGVWRPDGVIVFSAWRGGLYQVPARGGDPELLLDIDPDTEVDFHTISLLPDGKSLLFSTHRVDPKSREWVEETPIEALAGGERKLVLSMKGTSLEGAVYSPSGHLLYDREGANGGLWAAPFSASSQETTGPPFLVTADGGHASVARDGTLVYVPAKGGANAQLSWIDLEGHVTADIGSPFEAFGIPRISPDGRYIAVGEGGRKANIFVYDAEKGTRRQMTFGDAGDNLPSWSPSGDRIAYTEGVDLSRSRLKVVMADGSGKHEVLGDGNTEAFSPDGESTPGLVPVFTHDGNQLLYSRFQAATGSGRDTTAEMRIWRLALTGHDEPEVLPLGFGASFAPVVSPDGSHIAFAGTGQTGADHVNVFVCRLPEGGSPRQVSIDGGDWPRWSAEGDRIYYLKGTDLMAVSFDPGPPIDIGKPKRVTTLPETVPDEDIALRVRYDISPVDNRILVARPIEGVDAPSSQAGFVVVQNWSAKFAGE